MRLWAAQSKAALSLFALATNHNSNNTRTMSTNGSGGDRLRIQVRY